MPWQEESTVELRRQFVEDVRSGAAPVSELCAAYRISRKTGYKWLARYEAGGLPALADRSRRPHTCPTATPPELVQLLLAARARHPSWGPRKLLRLVQPQLTGAAWPARSTLALHLKRAGLVTPPRRVRRPGPPGPPQAPMDAPNAVWTADFKGQFRLDDGSLCYPLTIADGYSRLLLSCRALASTQAAESRPVFVRAFQAYGLPLRIRSDNGVPFATQALADATPASHYTPSSRPYPHRLPPLEYPEHYEVRRVSHNGGIRWHCTWVNVSQTLGGEVIGLVEIDDGEWDVYFGPLRLGRFHERTLHIEDALGRQHRRHY